MNLDFNCPGCGQPTFELWNTRYNLCSGCEARMTPHLVIYAANVDEGYRFDVTEYDVVELAYLIGDLEADDAYWSFRWEMLLTVTSHPMTEAELDEVVQSYEAELNAECPLVSDLPERCDCGCHPGERVRLDDDEVFCCDCPTAVQPDPYAGTII